MKTVALPIEIKAREFHGKLWLASVLTARGYRVALGDKTQIDAALDRIQPDVYFGGSAVDRDARVERYRKLRRLGARVLVLDTEGGAFEAGDYDDRTADRVLKHVDAFLAWGEASGEAVERNSQFDRADISITGNPRFDLLQPDLRPVYADEAAGYRNTHGEYVLVNTNFSINHAAPDLHKQFAKRDLQDIYRHQTEVLGEFLSAVCRLSDELPDASIVVRPHPSEDPNLYKKLFSAHEEVYVRSDGEARSWIAGASAVVHNGCTTGIETALLGRPVIAYLPTKKSAHGSEIANAVSHRVGTKVELIEAVGAACHGERSFDWPEGTRERLRRHIDNLDYLSAERIADVVDANAPDSTGEFESTFAPPLPQRGKRLAVGTVGVERYKRLRSSRFVRERWPYYNYKFDGLSVEEVEQRVRTIRGSQPGPDIEVNRVETIPDSVWLSSRNQ